MPALIDNYTAIECVIETHPRVASVRYTTELYRSVASSITVSVDSKKGINQRILSLLNEFKTLEDNWDEEDAEAPNHLALSSAIYLTKLLEKHGQAIFHAAPGPNSEIMLDVRNNKNTKSLELIFYADRAVSVFFPKDGNPSQQPFDFQNLPELLQWLNQK